MVSDGAEVKFSADSRISASLDIPSASIPGQCFTLAYQAGTYSRAHSPRSATTRFTTSANVRAPFSTWYPVIVTPSWTIFASMAPA